MSKASRGAADLLAAGLPLSAEAESYMQEMRDLKAEDPHADVEGSHGAEVVQKTVSMKLGVEERVRSLASTVKRAEADSKGRRGLPEREITEQLLKAASDAEAAAQELAASGFGDEVAAALEALNALGASAVAREKNVQKASGEELGAQMQEVMAEAIRTVEQVEAENSLHEAQVAAMSPDEAQRLLEEQEAKHQDSVQGQLRLLQGQLAEAAAVARELEAAGLESDYEAVLKDMEDLRDLARSLGADEEAMSPSKASRRKMRGAAGLSRAVGSRIEARMQQLMAEAIKTVEAVEARNAQHKESVDRMSPDEAHLRLEEQDANHREQMEGQLRLLEGQMREAAAVAREMEESGMEADHEAMLKDLEDLRALAKSLGASMTEDQADLVPLRTKHKKMRGAGGVMEATKGPLEARMQQLMAEAIKTMEAVEAQNNQHEQIVANMTPEEARRMLEEQDAKHREQMEGQLRLLEGQMREAAAVAREMEESGMEADHEAMLKDLEDLRALAKSLGASMTEDQADLVPLRTKHKKMRGAGGVMEATKGSSGGPNAGAHGGGHQDHGGSGGTEQPA